MVCAFGRDDVALWGLGNSFSVISVIGLHFDAFALKFDLIKENYEVNATFSANFCLNGCFC